MSKGHPIRKWQNQDLNLASWLQSSPQPPYTGCPVLEGPGPEGVSVGPSGPVETRLPPAFGTPRRVSETSGNLSDPR